MCIHHFFFITFEEFYEIYERFLEEYEEYDRINTWVLPDIFREVRNLLTPKK